MKATTVSPRRSSRLKSREPSAKAASERNLRSKNVVTTSKTSRKVNVNARDKSSSVSAKNLSVRNSQVSSICLRPRKNKNYHGDSSLLKRYILPKQQGSVVMLENINRNDKKLPVYKAMESSEKSSEVQNDVYDFKFDINDTREKAKKKPRKRNVNKGKGKTTKKTTSKKNIAQSKMIDRKAIKSPEPNANFSKKIAENELALGFAESIKQDIVKTIATSKVDTDIQTEKLINKDSKEIEPRIDRYIQTVKESTKGDIVDNMEAPRADIDIPAVEETTFPDETFAEQIREDDASKPRIISVENANNIIVTNSPPNNTDNSWNSYSSPDNSYSSPFRPKNIFDNKTSLKEYNGKIECSLLTKTLSPIVKTANIFDLRSPWRPPTLMFSQTKHFIQSTPYRNLETKEIKKTNKKSMEVNKENAEMDKENTEMDKENIEMDKENMDMNKENTGRRDKERKKKTVVLRKKHAILQRKLPISENRKKVRAAVASKSVVQPAPARISLGEIKNLLQKPNNDDNKQTVDQAHAETDKSLVEQKNKQLVDLRNFSDTFDVLSDSERLSNVGNDAPLFMDLEPSHFSKPPQHSYRRKRTVKFDFSEDSGEEDKEKENVKPRIKKKKLTKSEKEQEKRINEWIHTINTTFQEIDEYDLVIE